MADNKQEEEEEDIYKLIKKRTSMSGCLGNLDREQKRKLFSLWITMLKYFEGDISLSAKNKKAVLAKMEEFVKNADYEIDMEKIHKNPLKMESFRQISTDDPDTVFLRFLRARKWILNDAFVMLVGCVEWRHSFNIYGLLKNGESCLKRQLFESGKGYMWKEDKEGRLVIYVKAKLHDRRAQTIKESIDYGVYWMENGRMLRRFDEQLVTLVIDLQGIGMNTFDLPFIQFFLKAMESYYPEILGKVLLINAPLIFWGFWKIVKGLLDPVVASKIEFIKKEQIKDFIDVKNIPSEFGGENPYSYHYVAPESNKPPKSRSENLTTEELKEKMSLEEEFIEKTKEIQILYQRSENLDESNVENQINQIESQRSALKIKMRKLQRKQQKAECPSNIYHRMGILNEEDWVVCWDCWDPVHSLTKKQIEQIECERLCSSEPPLECK